MNKQLFYLSMILAGLITACSTDHSIEVPVSHSVEVNKNGTSKPVKRRHKPQLEGVISVDIVNRENRLHLLTGKQQPGQKSLWYKYSNDGGISWSDAVQILENDNLPAKIGRGSDAQIVAQGNIILVSWVKYVAGARFNSGPMLTARSADSGKTWQYVTAPPDWEKGPHSYIDMAADKDSMHVVWLDSRNGRSDTPASQGLRYAQSSDGGLSWQTNKTLDEMTCSCCWNTAKSDSNGNTYVLYRDKQPSDFSIGVINNELSWQRLNHVGAFNWQFDGCPHIGGSLDFQNTAGNNRVHAVVGSGHPEHLGVHYLYSNDSGKSWSDSMRLGDESAIHADIAAHDDGRVVAIWDMMGDVGLAVFFAESKNQGISWSHPKQLSTVSARATHPRIVKTEQGFLSLWTEYDGQQQILATQRL